MASDETPADVIEQAAKVIWDADNADMPQQWRDSAWDDMGGSEPTLERTEYVLAARALQAAGLLADPAGRYEPYDQLDNQRNLWAKQCHEAEARAERVEAELDELRATVDQVATLRDRWARLAGEAMDADTREWLDAVSKSLRAALGGGEQP